jgi:flagellar hook-associated protein 3 FlgL
MRITPSMTSDNALYNLQQGRSKLERLQEQISSQVQYNRPSDDPITTRQLLGLDERLAQEDQYSSNIKKAKVWLNMSASALQGMDDTLAQVKRSAATIANGSSDPVDQASVVAQLQEFKKSLVDLGNTQVGDQYLFAGFKDDKPPFSQAANSYSGGTTDIINTDIATNSKLPLNVTGDKLLTNVGAGGINVLDEIDNLITAIQTPPSGNVAAIQSATKNIETAATELKSSISSVAGRQMRLDNAQKLIEQNRNTINGLVADVQGVDLIKAGTELNLQKTGFQAALSATAQVTQLSLLDYIR